MKTDIATLGSMGVWEIIEQDYIINGIQSTWYFRCKRFPYGIIKNFRD